MILISEIPVVKILSNWNTRKYLWRKFWWIFIPLFPSVIFEYLFIKNLSNSTFSNLLSIIDCFIFDLILAEPFLHLLFCLDVGTAKHINSCYIGWYWYELTINNTNDFMFPSIPFGIFLYIFPNSMVVCMEEVRSIFIDQKTILINIIVAVSGYMISWFDYQDFFVIDISESFSSDASW